MGTDRPAPCPGARPSGAPPSGALSGPAEGSPMGGPVDTSPPRSAWPPPLAPRSAPLRSEEAPPLPHLPPSSLPPPRHMAMLGLGPLRASLRVPLSLPPSPATATPPPQADAPQTTSAWKAQAGLSWAGAAMVGPRSAHAGGGASAEPRPLEGPASWAPCQGPPDLPWAFPAASFQGASGGCLPGTAQKDRASGGSTWVPTPPPSP